MTLSITHWRVTYIITREGRTETHLSDHSLRKLVDNKRRARTWKQPKCPSTDEWIKKMWHIYTMEYDSAIKRNETELFVVRWMDLESVIQSEVCQKEKNKYHMLTHIYMESKRTLVLKNLGAGQE